MNAFLSFRAFGKLVAMVLAFLCFSSFSFSQKPRTTKDIFDSISSRLDVLNSKLDVLDPKSSPSPVTSPSSFNDSPASSIPENRFEPSSPQTGPGSIPPETTWSEDQGVKPPKKIETTSLQKEFGSYYFQVFGGYAIPSDVSLTTTSTDTGMIETDSGYQLGILTGRRFGNWMGELHLAYGEVGYDGFSPDVSSSLISYTNISGESKLFDIGVKMSYGVPIGMYGWIYAGLGAGLGFRDDSLSRSISIMGHPKPPIQEVADSTVFSYTAFLGLGYAFTDVVNARMGYRFLGTGENESFGTLRNHLIEVALGGSF